MTALHEVVARRTPLSRPAAKKAENARGTTLGDTAAAKENRHAMVEIVRKMADKGRKAAEMAAVEAGFAEKEVQAYLKFASAADNIEFEGDDEEEGNGASEDRRKNSNNSNNNNNNSNNNNNNNNSGDENDKSGKESKKSKKSKKSSKKSKKESSVSSD